MDTPITLYGGLLQRLRRDFQLFRLSLSMKSPLETARHAFQQTVFYRHLFQGFPENFSLLPIVSSEDFAKADPYDLLAEDAKDSIVCFSEVSAADTPTGIFLSSAELKLGLTYAQISPFIGLIQRVLDSNRVVVSGVGATHLIAGEAVIDIVRATGGIYANARTASSREQARNSAALICQLCPSILIGSTIDILSWLRALKDDFPESYSRVIEYLKIIVTTSSPCSLSRSRAIQKEFDVDHINLYTTEVGFLSLSCPCGDHHLLPSYLVELADSEGKINPLPNLASRGGKHRVTRERGRLVVTHLTKRSTPLIRYLVDDFVEVFSSNCPYGFHTSITHLGRFDETVIIRDKHFGIQDFEEILFKQGLGGDYRLLINDTGINVTLEEYGKSLDTDLIELDLTDQFAMPAQVKVVPFGTFAFLPRKNIVRLKSDFKPTEVKPTTENE